MSVSCPNGHTSESTDYCDICGTPIPAGAPAAPAAPAPAGAGGNSLDLPAAGGAPSSGGGVAGAAVAGGSPAGAVTEPAPDGPKVCPNCSTANAPESLFCEGCGYDFTTGALPAGAGLGTPSPTAAAEGPGEEGSAALAGGTGSAPGTGGSAATAGGGIPPRIPFQWVAEVWIDPDWYADQEATEPLPSPGLPVTVPLRVASALIGRRSASRNIVPDIDCSADPGVSRRHAQLTTDGSRWFVEDLQSSNGTYVGPATGALPDDPIPVGPKTEVGDNRIYVGAWTRIVVRRATDEEIALG